MESGKYIEVENVPIFRYGMADNKRIYITEETIRDAFKDYKLGDIPIVRGISVVGMIKEPKRYEDNIVYGDIIMMYDEPPYNKFVNYAIQVIESEVKDGVAYISKLKVISVTLANSKMFGIFRKALRIKK